MLPGRPRTLDDVKRGEILALLNAGLEFHEAARYVGCTPRTIRREIARNAVFRRDVHDALLAARLAPEKLLRQAAGRNWRAAAWLLERTAPASYTRRAPAACSLEDLDAACRWFIEVALQTEDDFVRRDKLFDRLWAAAEDVKNQVARRTDPRKPINTPPTILYDITVAVHQVKPAPIPHGVLSAGGENQPDKKRATFVDAHAGKTPENYDPGLSAGGQKS